MILKRPQLQAQQIQVQKRVAYWEIKIQGYQMTYQLPKSFSLNVINTQTIHSNSSSRNNTLDSEDLFSVSTEQLELQGYSIVQDHNNTSNHATNITTNKHKHSTERGTNTVTKTARALENRGFTGIYPPTQVISAQPRENIPKYLPPNKKDYY